MPNCAVLPKDYRSAAGQKLHRLRVQIIRDNMRGHSIDKKSSLQILDLQAAFSARLGRASVGIGSTEMKSGQDSRDP